MIRVSTRFAVGMLVLLGVAAATRLTVLRDARGEDPCVSAGAIKATSLIPGTTALGERLEELDGNTIQWSEGEVGNPVSSKLPMQFQIVRSYDAPSLYWNPLRFYVGPDRERKRTRDVSEPGPREPAMQVEDLRIRELESGGAALPIHVAWDHTDVLLGRSRLMAWFFVFDNRPVRSPLSAQLANSLNLAVGGPRPLTIVTISAIASEKTTAVVEEAAIAWLEGTWSYMAGVCRPR